MLVLDTHDWSRGRVDELPVLRVLSLEVLLESREVLHVDLVHFSEGEASGGLGVDKLTKGSLVLDDAVGDVLSSAEGWEESHHLDWLNIVSNDDELGLTFLNESSDVVETELEDNWLGTDVLSLVASLSSLSLALESLLLGRSSLWLVSVQELEQLAGLVLVKNGGEDVQGSGLLESHHEDSLLPLDSNILGPLHEPGQVASGLDVTADSEVPGGLLEQRVGALLSTALG